MRDKGAEGAKCKGEKLERENLDEKIYVKNSIFENP